MRQPFGAGAVVGESACPALYMCMGFKQKPMAASGLLFSVSLSLSSSFFFFVQKLPKGAVSENTTTEKSYPEIGAPFCIGSIKKE